MTHRWRLSLKPSVIIAILLVWNNGITVGINRFRPLYLSAESGGDGVHTFPRCQEHSGATVETDRSHPEFATTDESADSCQDTFVNEICECENPTETCGGRRLPLWLTEGRRRS
jgi:hypothetical protein